MIKTLLPMQGAQVPSLLRELTRSCTWQLRPSADKFLKKKVNCMLEGDQL